MLVQYIESLMLHLLFVLRNFFAVAMGVVLLPMKTDNPC